jgi:hypothetical protein
MMLRAEFKRAETPQVCDQSHFLKQIQLIREILFVHSNDRLGSYAERPASIAATGENVLRSMYERGFQELKTTPLYSATSNQEICGEFRSIRQHSMVGLAHRPTGGWSSILETPFRTKSSPDPRPGLCTMHPPQILQSHSESTSRALQSYRRLSTTSVILHGHCRLRTWRET